MTVKELKKRLNYFGDDQIVTIIEVGEEDEEHRCGIHLGQMAVGSVRYTLLPRYPN